MTRITFITFTIPVVAQAFLMSVKLATVSSRFSPLLWVRTVRLPLGVATFLLGGIIAIDTIYFRGDITQVVLTPYNNLLYNMSPTNLAEHGLHPRWLHVAVNLPLVVGPGLVIYGLLAIRRLIGQARSATGKDGLLPEAVISRSKSIPIYMFLSC